WDSGKGGDGKSSTAGFLSGLAGSLPPVHELARNAGIELPAYLGTPEKQEKPAPPAKPASPPVFQPAPSEPVPPVE
ncbi:MAG: flotillin family protein, partial [Verrucomicrobiae bacterium]|nr:flotillin family protein [Verrucomicrobiae bacterium]